MRTTSSSSYLTTYSTGRAKNKLKKIVGASPSYTDRSNDNPNNSNTKAANAQTSQSPSVFLDPATYNATQLNQQFTVDINISNVQNLWGWAINVTWDTNYLTLVSKQEGDFLSSQYPTLFTPSPIIVVPGADRCGYLQRSVYAMRRLHSFKRVRQLCKWKRNSCNHDLPNNKTDSINSNSSRRTYILRDLTLRMQQSAQLTHK